MRSRPGMATLASAAGLVAALAGCAVLRIDVDVYKGPLANEEAVQMEQFTAMAIGAKPLLIALRDRLQWPDDVEKERKLAKEAGWYKAGFAKPPLKDAWKGEAGRVNQVLFLYDNKSFDEDRRLKNLEPYLAKASRILEEYRDAIATLQDKTGNRESWNRIRKGFVAVEDKSLREKFDIEAGTDVSGLKNAFVILTFGHQRVFGLALNPKDFEFNLEEAETATKISKNWGADALYIAYENFLRTMKKVDAKQTEMLLRGRIDGAEIDRGSNHRYEQLRQQAVLDAQSAVLFKDPGGPEARLFKEKTAGFATAFLDARQSLRNLWLNSLDALRFVSDSAEFGDAAGASVKRSYAKLISLFTQHQYLSQALNATVSPQVVRVDLMKSLSRLSTVWTQGIRESEQKFQYDLARNSLEAALNSMPLDVASWLKEADSWFIDISEQEFGRQQLFPANLKYAARRRFGLVRGPISAGKLGEIFDQVESALGETKSIVMSLGLGGGRLPTGIESLIEDYLKKATLVPLANDRDSEAVAREEAKVRLRDALVRFSEKVLFIANNDKLLSQNQKGIDRYVLVLQAVGNSIQIQANELKAQETFHEELGFREAPEIWAQETAVKKCDSACAEICPAGPCGKGYRDWSTEIAQGVASDAQSGKRSQRQVLDDMIALLRYEHILAVKAQGNGSDAAIHLAQALAVAYEQRAGMAYIRPSGAYLRSSYPATSLQDDPRLGWRNMLTEHGRRTMPIIGEWWALGDKDEQSRAKITAEIDKQFWQNINSVRVAGAGITNYVIVKDDVGNWYVKSYASNPAPIIKSAKSLAMFGIGQGFDPDLMAKALKDKKTDGAGDKKKAEKPPPPDPALGPVFNRKREKYAKATDADFESARILLDKRDKSPMVENIENAWKNNSDAARFETDLGMALEIAFGEASQQVPSIFAALKGEPDAISQGQAGQILAALGEIKRFHATLSAEIKTLKLKKRADIKVKGAQDAKVELENDLAKLKVDHEKAKTDGAAAEDIEKIEKDIEAKNGEIATADDSVKKLEADAAHAEAAETAALSEAGRVVGITASRLIEKRLKAVADYEAAVLFISDANTRPKTNSGN